MAKNTPTTIFEALLFLWSRDAEGKDRRSLTDYERKMLDELDLGGTTSYYRFGVEIHDADGTPYVRGAWSHAMTWQFFQGRQAGIELLVGEYAGQEYSEFVGLDEKLQGVLKYLDSLQLHFPLFLDYMLDGCPALADEWPAPTDKQPPAQPEIVIKLEVQQSAQATQLKPGDEAGDRSAAKQVGVEPRLTAQDRKEREQVVSTYIRKRREKDVPIERISRDGIARATGVPSTAVSGTRAWVALAKEKKQAKAKPPLRGQSTSKDDDLLRGKAGENIDAAIDRQDWEAVKAAQKRMQRSKR